METTYKQTRNLGNEHSDTLSITVPVQDNTYFYRPLSFFSTFVNIATRLG